MSRRITGRSTHLLLAIAVTLGASSVSQAQQFASVNVKGLSVGKTPIVANAAATNAGGDIEVVLRLVDKPLAAVAGNKRTGVTMTAAQQRAYAAGLRQKQATVMSQAQGLGARKLAGLVNASNALVVEIPASQAVALARIPGVAQVMPVGEYKLDLSETVPHIGAAALQNIGVDGTGVRVAVLDSGADFMHYNLGGTGKVDDFDLCYGQANVAPSGICANFYGPSAPKVTGGWDFVGENWTGTAPNTVLQPDPNPIARRGTGGHGTHVADIILGKSADGMHKGVAPEAKLYAVKVCSAVSSSCSGLAILQGVDYALDPNGDGDLSDAVDVMNLSLGASYGQRENASVLAINQAGQFGVVPVVSAGNSANRPFITGSPSSAAAAISVAQTQVPSATAVPLVISSPASIARTITNTASVAWATGSFAGNVGATSGPATPAGNDACAALPPGSLNGLVALIRRGTCAVSIKVENARAAGAVGVLIDNNAIGDPPSFSQGSPGPFVPTLVISLADGNLLRGRLAAGDTVTVATGSPVPAVGSLVTTSSRGPNMQIGALKPDIGAPGASLSAETGTGNGETVFGGTSGAAPMVAGSAALLLQSYPTLQPHEVKARLMNAAEINVTTYAGPAGPTNALAPLSRIGGGEVRVDRSHALTTAAWDTSDPRSVSLSMGVQRTIGMQTLRKRVTVRNYAPAARTYTIGREFRYANDQASGAVNLSFPATVTVPANGAATFTVTSTINSTALPNWQSTGINGGSNGGDGSLLDLPEYDGFITITDGSETVRLPWHVLPHRAANVVAPTLLALSGNPQGLLPLTNTGGAVGGRLDVFYLTGTSPQIPASQLPAEGGSYAIVDLRAVGTRLVQIGGDTNNPVFGAQFAINTYGQRSHPNYPAGFQIFIDQDNNGTDDIIVSNQESGGFASSGQNVVLVRKALSGCTSGLVFFSTDADLSSANAILTIPLAATLPNTGACTGGQNLALTPNSVFSYRAVATDNYFTGAVTDSIGAMQISLGNPRFFPDGSSGTVPQNTPVTLPVIRNAPGDAASPSQSGLLIMYRDARFGREADMVTVTP
jgi:hypothetical protein